MTLKEAHNMLDEEYAKDEIVTIGYRQCKIPNSVRVIGALIKTTEKAKEENLFQYAKRA